jgi:hypothetical protein
VKRSWNSSSAFRSLIGSLLLIGALTAQALAAATIKGKVMVPNTAYDVSQGFVVATNEKMEIYRVAVDADGSYLIENVNPGTYTISALLGGLTVPDVKGVAVKDGDTIEQNFAMTVAEPFCILKAAAPIPLDKDIDSDAFADADEIRIDQAKNVGVGPVEEWGALGGPDFVSGRFKVKYSDQAIHLAGEVKFKNPLVNVNTGVNSWIGNAIEFDLQDDPFDVTRENIRDTKEHNWHLIVGLGAKSDWWEHNVVMGVPRIDGKETQVDQFIKRTPTASGEKLRLDMPWKIFVKTDASGQAISPPKDDALGAANILIDAADPAVTEPEDYSGRKYQIQWSGFGTAHWNGSQMIPVRFCTKRP